LYTKSKTLKLAPLLAQYLQNNGKLDLHGIGRFDLGQSPVADPNSKYSLQSVNFISDVSVKPDEDLISFISSQTGKMKALASSDLNSYLDLAKEFLNIGKPFLIEGVGTLVKKGARFEFTADHLLTEKIKESGIKELSATSTSDESFTTYENLKPRIEKTPPYKKLFLVFLVVATTIAVIWGGYKMYKNNIAGGTAEENKDIVATDTTHVTPPVNNNNQPSTTLPQDHYRFVIEVANKERALQRYNQIKGFGKPIELSTADSSVYKLYFVLQATASDTAHIADSLTALYPALNRRKAFTEN
jgi:hypothetical protein